jgi:WD40 repeat protein
MDTVESRTEEQPLAGTVYDGFISYSHAADDLLAPRLQAGLQRFAKPWWKRRALRIFRDESSLSANPHLWSSITDALDQSGWFVLLLSPDAAESPWVNNEVEYWLEHKDADKIIPVLTDGDFTWFDDDFISDAAPPALQGAFSDEPRWVDLRFARTEEQLDLKNPRFSAAVADIASAIRGVPKDELESEEVKQHRRTTRTAWAAGILVAVLGVAAVVFGIESSRNADLAEANAQAEAEQRAEAVTQRELAQENEATAIAEADRADTNAALAKARELAASAIGVVDTDPRLATWLSLLAIDQTPEGEDQPVEVVNALWKSVAADPLDVTIEHGFDGNTFVDLSPDGRTLAISSSEGATLELRDADTLEVFWTYSEQTEDGFARPVFSPDGSLIAIDVMGSLAEDSWRQSGVDDLPNRVVVLNAASGHVVKVLEFPGCENVWAPAWSPGGSLMAVSPGFVGCYREDVSSPFWIEVFDTTTWESQAVLGLEGDDIAVRALFLSEDRLGAFRASNPLEIYDTSTFELVDVVESVASPVTPAVSITAGLIAAHSNETLLAYLYDLETGAQLDVLGELEAWPSIPFGFSFSPDGRLVAGATFGRVLVWDVTTGEQIYRLTSGSGASNAVFNSDGTKLYSAHSDGAVRVWSLNPGGSVVRQVERFPSGSFINGNSFSIGDAIGTMMRFEFEPQFSAFIEFFSTETGELVAPALLAEGQAITLPDDRVVVHPQGQDGYHVYDPRTGLSESVGPPCSENLECGIPMMSADHGQFALTYLLEDGSQEWRFFSSRSAALNDASVYTGTDLSPWGFGDDWVLHSEGFTEFVFLDRESGDELLRVPMEARGSSISNDGRTVVLSPGRETLTLVDTLTWEIITLDLGFGRMRGVSFSPTDSLLAVADEDEVFIVDIARREIVQEVPFALVSDIHWISDSEILIGNRDGSLWGTLSLKTEVLIELAGAAVNDRPLSLQECSTYRIEPCPAAEGAG